MEWRAELSSAAESPRRFFRGWSDFADRTAIVDASGLTLSYRELGEWTEALTPPVAPDGRRSLGFLFCESAVEHLAVYLAALRQGQAITILNDHLSSDRAEALVRAYRPDWIVASAEQQAAWESLGYTARPAAHDVVFLVATDPPDRPEPHPDLRLMVSTSGSTGGGKMVRLSERNLVSNAESIAAYMELDPDHRALVTLPLHYCFGLSVVHSHLAVGGTLLLNRASFIQPDFWRFAAEERGNFLAGVPFHFETWQRLGLPKLAAIPLRILAQAGGPLDPKRQEVYRQFAEERGAKFLVMYGQSEATARISYVPSDQLADNLGSIGIAIPRGELRLDPETGEIIYEGPNVMMGYATGGSDISRGDDLGGVLHTGDVGAVNGNGLFRIVGRLKRFVKMFGERVSLDELERDLRDRLHVGIACTGSDNKLLVAVDSEEVIETVKEHLRDTYRLRAAGLTVRHVPELPRLPTGKLDYTRLQEAVTADA